LGFVKIREKGSFMKKIILFSIFSASLFSETLSNISFESENDGEIAPKIFLPLYWNENLFSAVKYSTSSTTTVESVSRLGDNKNSETVNEQSFGLHILSFKKSFSKRNSISLGLEIEQLEIEKKSFGYIDNKDKYSEILVSDNSVNIDVFRSGFYLEYFTNPLDWLFIRTSADLTPFAKVDIQQKAELKPFVQEHNLKAETEFDFSYSLLGEITIKTPWNFFVGGEFGYTYFPMNYDILTVSESANSFQKTEVDEEIKTSFWIAKLIFDLKAIGNLQPSIGFGERTKKNGDDSLSEKIVKFGFEKRF
jgi:hypothetical protein